MRPLTDDQGRHWEAFGDDAVVAHMRKGAVLAFRPADEPAAEPVRTTITFNSQAAADLAIRSMSEKDLLRRLDWAKTSAGVA
ncbi:MAG TPA: hypothetical protein VF705_00340 [Longimicrobium sp.]|jgi:hypothetical protein